MRKSVSAVDMEWLSNRADTLLLAHLTHDFPVPTAMLAAGMTKKATTALQQRYPRANFSITDLKLTTLPVANHSIDLFIANLLTEHETDLVKLFAEVERVLSDDGLLLFTTNDSRTKSILGKYAQAITDDLVDENSTTEKLEKIDVMRFFFRRYHILLIEKDQKYIDSDVFIASAAFPLQLLKKLLEYPIRIDEVVLQAVPVLVDKEAPHAEKKEQEHEEADEDEQEIEEVEEKVEASEPKEEIGEEREEVAEKPEIQEDSEPEEKFEAEAIEAKEIEPEALENSENERAEVAEDKEHDVDEQVENKEGKMENESELENEPESESEEIEHNEHEKVEILEREEPEESNEAEDEDTAEEEPEELEESEERKGEAKEDQPEPAEKEKLESSEYRELHTLSGLLHENEKALQEHEAVMTKELHNTVRVLSKSQLMHSNADVKQKQTKQLEQHKQLLNNYRALTNKHKDLVGDFMQSHARLLENYADPVKKFQQLITRQTNVVKRHDANIEQHEMFLNTKK